jgi:pyrimidine-nucleoside phosphorylase
VTPYEVIHRKRDGAELPAAELRAFLEGYGRGEVADYQMSAFLMAVFFRGLAQEELGAWTRGMLESGEVLDLSDIPGAKVDKHSTGGVGDKVSLCLAPLVAACGVRVPMISGRGLGHTGGTLDKLESIPGFRVDLSIAEYRKLVREVGACLIGQTATLAPADKRLYALRDVTATIECIPLIASSIMSKKLAEGIDALVLDVKVGSGAFMKREADARILAQTMIDIGTHFGRRVTALLTDMDQPLGRAVGNALEVEEAVAVLRGEGPTDVTEVTFALGAEMLVLGGAAGTAEAARSKLEEAVRAGTALAKLEEIVSRQGGDARVVRDGARLPRARLQHEVRARSAGFICAIDSEAVGLAGVALGAGRQRVDSAIDPAVGFELLKKIGDKAMVGEPLVRIHANDEARLPDIERRLAAAYALGPTAPRRRPLVLERLSE